MKSSGLPSKKKKINRIIDNKKTVQYGSLSFEIDSTKFPFLYEIKCKIKNNPIKPTSNLLVRITSIVPDV